MKNPAMLLAALGLICNASAARLWAEPAAPASAPIGEKAPAEHRWEKDIEAFEAADKKNPPPADAAVFVGSSSIRYWTTLATDFPEIPTIRRGFGGSYLSDSAYFADRIVTPYKPRIVVVFAGGNDLAAGRKPEDVLHSFQELVGKVNAVLPATKIAYISINPTLRREQQLNITRKANGLIEEFTKDKPNLLYINSFDALLGADGRPQASLLRADGLHLNAEGYKKWVALVKPAILKLYQDPAPAAK